MNDRPFVSHRERPRDVRHDRQRGGLVGLAVAGDPVGEIPASDEFDRKIMKPVIFVDLDEVGNVRAIDLGEHSRLFEEPLERLGTARPARAEQFDGDVPAVGEVHGAIDRPHSALAQLLMQLEATELTTIADRVIELGRNRQTMGWKVIDPRRFSDAPRIDLDRGSRRRHAPPNFERLRRLAGRWPFERIEGEKLLGKGVEDRVVESKLRVPGKHSRSEPDQDHPHREDVGSRVGGIAWR